MAIDMLGKRDENLNTSASCCFDRWLDSTLATFNAVAFVVARARIACRTKTCLAKIENSSMTCTLEFYFCKGAEEAIERGGRVDEV